VKAGGTLVPPGTCAVSFKTDILANIFAGAQCSQTTCHGGLSPASLPRVDTNDAPGMWTEFAAFKLSNGKLFINPCSTDPAQSMISVNVNGNAPAGDRGVLMPQNTTGLSTDQVNKISDWQKCGAPNN
jgi:hypothetical protein